MKFLVIFLKFMTLITFSCSAYDRVVCYYGSWAVYRNGNGKFDVEDISTNLCTHIIYSFVGLNNDGSVRVLDTWNDIDLNAIGRFVNLKSKNSALKVIIAMGGWNEGSETFSIVTNNVSLRKNLVINICSFIEKFGFDGFDLDWEYPAQRGGSSSDYKSFIDLIKELRNEFNKKGWLLSAAVSSSKKYHLTSYNVPEINKYLDFINIMTYDLHGSWDGVTGQNAPLYASSIDTTAEAKLLNVDASIKGWIESGADPSKINLGMATYGRSFTLQSATNNKLGAPTTNGGNGGPYTNQMGFLGFLEICEAQAKGGWITVFDNEQKNPYTYNNNQWIGYDNIESITLKSQYILNNKLGGAMIWSIETDDAKNVCGFGQFPLLQTINNVLRSNSNINTTTTVPTPTTTKVPTTTTSTSTTSTISTTTNSPTTTISTTDITTDNPITTTPTSPNICGSGAPFVRDPVDCAIFYMCEKIIGSYNIYKFKCPTGLYFDTTINVCNYPFNVIGCN